ncbi:MAG: DUF4142 domain-containing protein [Pseudomonadota bacterium]|nr:DUF4142 domain-containing protein [Pseudomonadota bacterium]
MRTQSLIFTAAMAVALAMAGCHKPNAAADTANTAAVTSNPVAAGAQDATAGAVGAAAATLGATTTTGFVTGAATSDMYEIAAAKIAAGKSTNPAVKAFAARMIHDHTASTAALKTILASGGASATPPAAMDKRRDGMVGNLTAAAPADFDKTYMDQQVAAHNEALTLFKGFADHGDNDALKAFAAKTAPTIQAHLDMANKIDGALK